MIRRVRMLALAAVMATAFAGGVPAEASEGRAQMSESEILAGANERIERYRKGDVAVRVVDGRGKPVSDAKVRIELVRHAFLFGCNAFKVNGFEDKGKAATYEREFATLFNYATLGFYWGAYEPAPGRTIAEHLRKQALWCRENDIAVKGHPLVWHEVYPGWAPSEVEETKEKEKARITSIVSGFEGLVGYWDVVNEATVSANYDNGVGHWAKQEGAAAMVTEALQWARAANPKATLLYNDYTVDEGYEAFAAKLVKDPKLVDALGIQSHMHRGEWPIEKVWEVCERYGKFGKPLHFTETTVLSGEHGWERPQPWPSTPEGEAKQAEYVMKLYTTLFSHPAVQAITWWDFNDGEWQGAPAGLVRADLTPKPAYGRLLALIRGKWWSRATLETDAEGTVKFRGFYGHYLVTADTPRGRAVVEMELTHGGEGTVTVVAK